MQPFFILAPFNFASGYNQLAKNLVLALSKQRANFAIDSRCNVVEEECVNLGFRTLERPSTSSSWKLFVYPLSQLSEKGQDALKWMEWLREEGKPEAFTPEAEAQYRRLQVGADKNYDIAVDEKTVVLTMWEVAYIRPDYVDILNRSALVIVPSQWCADVFRGNGVTTPIVKIPLGCDTSVFHPQDSWPRIPTFGAASAAAVFSDGRLVGGGIRKNLHQTLEVFHRAFEDIDDVRLKIKLPPYDDYEVFNDPRVEVSRARLTESEMADWYRSLTAFVSTSYGEGFGLHLLEAMACGRPVITTPFSGVTEYFDDVVGWSGAYSLEKIDEGPWHPYQGLWAQPNTKSFVKIFQSIYMGWKDAWHRGRFAAERAKQYTWDRMAERIAWQMRKIMR